MRRALLGPTRARRQLCEYGIGLPSAELNPENAVRDLVSFLPVLAYVGHYAAEAMSVSGITSSSLPIRPGKISATTVGTSYEDLSAYL